MTAPADVRAPSGRWVRRTTRRVQGARSGRRVGALVLEVWGAVVVLAVQAAVLGSAVVLLGEEVTARFGGPTAAGSDLPGALVALTLAGAVLGVAARLGPAGVGRAGATWWLPLPVDRRGLLRPTVLGWPAAAALAGGFGAPLAVLALGGRPDVADVVGWVGVGAAVTAVLVAVAVVVQTTAAAARAVRALALAGDVLMVTGAIGVAVAATTGHAWRLGGAWHVVVPVVATASVVLVAVADGRAERLDGALLRMRSGSGERARGAVLSLDLRELSRALVVDAAGARRRSLPLRPGGPRRALVLADAVLLTRTPRALGQLVVATALGACASTVLGGGPLTYGAWVLTGFWAVSALAAGARHADAVPALERMLPLSRRASRAVHGTVPLLGAFVWAAVVLGAEAWRTDEGVWWAVVSAWALVLTAAAVRAAYRPPSRYLATSVSTPMGGVPSTGGLLQGFDVAIAGTLPTAFAVLVGSVTAPGVLVQLVVAAATAWAVVRYVGRADG